MRYSHQREVIKKVVQNTNSHPTADWVFNQTKKIIPVLYGRSMMVVWLVMIGIPNLMTI